MYRRNRFLRVNILTILDSPLGAYRYESSNSIDRVLIFCDFTIRDPRNFVLYSQALISLNGTMACTYAKVKFKFYFVDLNYAKCVV